MSKEKYIGTKFQTIFLGDFVPTKREVRLIDELITVGHIFGAMGIKDQNGGNISVRVSDGFLIKRTGAHPYELKPSDFVKVVKTRGDKVWAYGQFEPSSEARMHEAIYKARPDINCILHCHDFLGVFYPLKFSDIGYIPEISYGTKESAKAVSAKAKTFDYLIQSNHGVIGLGKNIKSAMALIKKFHQRFVK
ncbi:MAG: class II aldolase/adducin family protein [Candidatus Falkowbacteria bacterium]